VCDIHRRNECFYEDVMHLRHGESHQVGANAEARALARRHADGGREDIQNREHGGGHDGHREDLIHGQLLTRDKHKGQGHGNALHYILYDPGQKVVYVHLVYIRSLDFFPGMEGLNRVAHTIQKCLVYPSVMSLRRIF